MVTDDDVVVVEDEVLLVVVEEGDDPILLLPEDEEEDDEEDDPIDPKIPDGRIAASESGRKQVTIPLEQQSMYFCISVSLFKHSFNTVADAVINGVEQILLS